MSITSVNLPKMTSKTEEVLGMSLKTFSDKSWSVLHSRKIVEGRYPVLSFSDGDLRLSAGVMNVFYG